MALPSLNPIIRVGTSSTTVRDLMILCLVCLGVLAPFLDKPVHVDDPLFIWTARQITAHPLEFDGFDLNWSGQREPITTVMINPPLLSYYLAGAARFIGWSEFSLHLAMLPFALLSVIGMYFLAHHFCRSPLGATLLLLLCPAFLVSATTMMCDIPMQCLWIWATVLWIRGSQGSMGRLILSGILAALAVLTKYYAVCLLPLFAAYALIHKADRKTRAVEVLALLIPISAIIAYNYFTKVHYGHALFSEAIGFSTNFPRRYTASTSARLLDALLFAGGGALGAALVWWAAASWRVRLCLVALVPVLIGAARELFQLPGGWSSPWPFTIQAGLFAAAGVCILWCCIADFFVSPASDRRQSIFLLMWTGGVFIFAARLNWSINARSMLPLVPPVCILTQRGLDRRGPRVTRSWIFAGLIAAVIGVLGMVADYGSAEANRWAAEQITHRYAGSTIRFTGHWGFQYYMQAHQAKPLDNQHPAYRPGDLVVVPLNNYGYPPPGLPLEAIGSLTARGCSFLTLLDGPVGAGYYFSPGDQLPMVFGPILPDVFVIFRVTGK